MAQTLETKSRTEYDWNSENIALLGTIPDAELARRMGGISDTIFRKRVELGISPFKHKPGAKKGKPRPNFDWNEQSISLLGTKSDRDVADQLGLSNTAVGAKRRALGIAGLRPPPTPTNVPTHLVGYLGVWSDQKVADQLGVSVSSVSYQRRKLKIKPLQSRNVFPKAANAQLGTMSDTDLARQLKISVSAVQARRSKLGIEKFSPLGAALGCELHRQNKAFSLPTEEVQHLGVHTDKEIAKRNGVSLHTIRRIRVAAGIPATISRVPFPPDKAHLLGTMSDQELAELTGLTPGGVGNHRLSKGIASFKSRQKPS